MTNANPLLTDSIPILIRRIGMPVAVGVLFNNLFQVADTFFAGMISKEDLAALTLSFPLYFIIIGLASGLGTGASALIGNALGAGKSEAAAHITAQGLTLTVALSLLTASIGIAVAPAVFQSLGATGNALRFNMSYITPIFAGTIFFNLVFMFIRGARGARQYAALSGISWYWDSCSICCSIPGSSSAALVCRQWASPGWAWPPR